MSVLEGEVAPGQNDTNTEGAEQKQAEAKPPAEGEAKPVADAIQAKPEGKEKPAEEAKVEGAKAPEKYEAFAMPKGFEFEEGEAEEFDEVVKKLDLDQKGAQEALDFMANRLMGLGEKHTEAWNGVRDNWVSSLKTDSEFGGTKYGETVERANRALGKYGSPELNTWLKESGFGDNPDLAKLLARVDRATGEGGVVDGAHVPIDGRSAAEVLYPNQGKS